MSEFDIQRPSWLATKQPLLYELAGDNRVPVRQGVLQGETTAVDLGVNQFNHITLFLPDSSKLMASLERNAEGAYLPVKFLDPHPSKTRVLQSVSQTPERLERGSRTIDVCPDSVCSMRFQILKSAVDLGPDFQAGATELVARLWSRREGKWSVVKKSEQTKLHVDPRSESAIRIILPPDTPHLVQYGHRLLGVRNTVAPPGEITVQMLLQDADARTNGRVLFDIDLKSSVAERLVSFLQSGQSERADVLAEAVLKESSVFAQPFDSIAAIVGCYYFLSTLRLERLDNWIDILQTRADRLPDTYLIKGWRLLQNPTHDFDKIRECFVSAIDCGLPVFSQGVRLLIEGVRLLQELHKAPGNGAELDRYAPMISSEQPYSTFAGINPNEPAAFGKPQDFELLNMSHDLLL